MRARAEWDRAFMAMAAAAGTGLIPGRAHALFFSQTGWAAWPAIAAAAAMFGALVGAVTWRDGGAGAVDRRAEALDPGYPGRLRQALRGLYAALAAAMMLARAGEIGALTLPLAKGYAAGAGLALLAALAVAASDGAPLPSLGAALTALVAAFYAALALDPRAVRYSGRSEIVLGLSGNWRAALLLATLFAAMNGCMAGLLPPPARRLRPAAVGAKAALLMGGALSLSSLALRRGGERMLAQAAPWARLSARWGLAGFWLCAGLEALCAATTLSVCAGALRARGGRTAADRAWRAAALLMAGLLFMLLSNGRL